MNADANTTNSDSQNTVYSDNTSSNNESETNILQSQPTPPPASQPSFAPASHPAQGPPPDSSSFPSRFNNTFQQALQHREYNEYEQARIRRETEQRMNAVESQLSQLRYKTQMAEDTNANILKSMRMNAEVNNYMAYAKQPPRGPPPEEKQPIIIQNQIPDTMAKPWYESIGLNWSKLIIPVLSAGILGLWRYGRSKRLEMQASAGEEVSEQPRSYNDGYYADTQNHFHLSSDENTIY